MEEDYEEVWMGDQKENKPIHLHLLSQKGEVIELDPFEATDRNRNRVVYTKSGAGMSFYTAQLQMPTQR